jgi:hypothetical protein
MIRYDALDCSGLYRRGRAWPGHPPPVLGA